MNKFKDYTITYEFTKSKFGFQNQITVNSNNEENARTKALDEIAKAYGSSMLKYFKIVKVI